MTGTTTAAGMEFFTAKRDHYQSIVSNAAAAETNLGLANQALGLLAKPTLTSEEAETLLAHYASLNGSEV